jgi:pimeloyl-ACP methyl ester carboxylesterase
MDAGASQDDAGVAFWQMERLREFRIQHPIHRSTVTGEPWEYIACGEGEHALLLLTGGLRVAESAFGLIQMFEKSFRVVAPRYPPVDSMDAMLDGIGGILDGRGVSEAVVLGQSYGGLVAQVLMRRRPSYVKKAILSGTAPLIAVGWKRLLAHLLPPLVMALPERAVMAMFKKIVSPMVTVSKSKRAFWEAFLDDLMLHRLTKADLLSHLRTTRDAYRHDVYRSGEMSRFSGDVLAIWGEDDHLNTERARKGMLGIYPQAQVHIITGAGHTAALSEPEEYAAAVNGFLEMG